MIFRQLLEPDTCSFTYLLSCSETGKTALIDPVLDTVERDLEVLEQLGLKLDYTIETHMHADHLTGAGSLRDRTGCRVAYPGVETPECADIALREGEVFKIGTVELHPIFAPGHTSHHYVYLLDNGTQKMLFTGDVLLIDGCGRTDFQSGDPGALYDAITGKLFTLPDETLVYPGHDYEGRRVSSIGQEKTRNPRLGGGKSREEFIQIMKEMDLPYPRKIDFAVPGNQQCGRCPPNVPEEFAQACRSEQG